MSNSEMNQKAQRVISGLRLIARQYAEEGKPNTGTRCLKVSIELEANPEVAARLFDILMEVGGAK